MKQPATEPGPKTEPKRVIKTFRFDRGSHVELAKALIMKLETNEKGRLCDPVYDEGNFYSYDPPTGVWRRVGEPECRRALQELDGSKTGKQFLKMKDSDARGAMSCARFELWKEGFFDSAPAGLAFKDCFVRIGEGGAIEKHPHSSTHRARFAYDFDYAEGEPIAFLAALGGMFQPDPDGFDKMRLVGEFAGASLLGGATRLQRWILLKGDGDDGKSTLIDIIRAAFPPGSCCSIKPEGLENEYERADLAGKLLNTVTEVKQRDYLQAETLKATVVGDEIRGRQIRQAPISFRPRAGHILAANGFPKFADSSHGFWRRPIVITFNHRFTNDPARDPGLGDKIVGLERQQIVCWLVRMGAAALARGKYIEPASHTAAIAMWRGETDAVFEFVDQACVIPTDLGAPSIANDWGVPTVLYTAFLGWAYNTGHKPMSSTAFGRRLSDLGYAERKVGKGLRLRPLRPMKKGETRGDDGRPLAEAPN